MSEINEKSLVQDFLADTHSDLAAYLEQREALVSIHTSLTDAIETEKAAFVAQEISYQDAAISFLRERHARLSEAQRIIAESA